jgi:hypothetical protein
MALSSFVQPAYQAYNDEPYGLLELSPARRLRKLPFSAMMKVADSGGPGSRSPAAVSSFLASDCGSLDSIEVRPTFRRCACRCAGRFAFVCMFPRPVAAWASPWVPSK